MRKYDVFFIVGLCVVGVLAAIVIPSPDLTVWRMFLAVSFAGLVGGLVVGTLSGQWGLLSVLMAGIFSLLFTLSTELRGSLIAWTIIAAFAVCAVGSFRRWQAQAS